MFSLHEYCKSPRLGKPAAEPGRGFVPPPGLRPGPQPCTHVALAGRLSIGKPLAGSVGMSERIDGERRSQLRVRSRATNHNRICDAIVKFTSDIPRTLAAWILRTTPKFPVTP